MRLPVYLHLDELTPTVAHAWLVRAARCIALSRNRADLRFLNAACKLTGAVWVYVRQRPSRGEGSGADDDWSHLTAGLGAVARLLDHATAQLVGTLANRPSAAEPATGDAPGPAQTDAGRRFAGPSRARIVVLAGAGSRSAGRLDAAAAAIGLPITSLCWYQPGAQTQTRHTTFGSDHDTAWYPPAPLTAPPGELPVTRHAASSTTARSWPEVTAALQTAEADLVVLVGMPIVPDSVLGAARLGVLNAHNGALPTVRGMDAVGWALLTNQPVVCTLHRVRRGVDTGEVITAEQVPIEPLAPGPGPQLLALSCSGKTRGPSGHPSTRQRLRPRPPRRRPWTRPHLAADGPAEHGQRDNPLYHVPDEQGRGEVVQRPVLDSVEPMGQWW